MISLPMDLESYGYKENAAKIFAHLYKLLFSKDEEKNGKQNFDQSTTLIKTGNERIGPL